MALLFSDFSKRVEIRSSRDGLIRFHGHAQAVQYLRRYSDRPGLTITLRRFLSEHHHLQVQRLTDAQVINEVARRLLNGSLQLMETLAPRVESLVIPEGEIEEQEAEEEVSPAPAPAELLPLLEELQIEGGEVLPEIDQTLEQIDMTAAGIETVTVSLEPAPSGIPAIGASILSSTSSIKTTLGAL